MTRRPNSGTSCAATCRWSALHPPVVGELGPESDFDGEHAVALQCAREITGLAQISGRNELSWDGKIDIDNRYLDRLASEGFRLDLEILGEVSRDSPQVDRALSSRSHRVRALNYALVEALGSSTGDSFDVFDAARFRENFRALQGALVAEYPKVRIG